MPMRSSPIRFIDFCRRICQSSSFIIFALPIQSIQSHLNHSPSPFFQAWDWHSITDFATQTDIFGLCAVAVCCGGVKSGFLLHSFIRLLDSCFACHITWCSCQCRRHKSVSCFCHSIQQSSSFTFLQFQFSVSSYLFDTTLITKVLVNKDCGRLKSYRGDIDED